MCAASGILGCGAAYIAGVMGAHLIEQLARLPCQAEPASEFRYRNPVIEMDTLYIAVSQSGETFDTLAAVQEIKRKGGRVLGIVNVVGSTIARECGQGIYLHAGPEIAVVSTKTFTCSVVALALLAVHLGRLRDLSTANGARLLKALDALPDRVAAILEREDEIARLADFFQGAEHAFYVGRAAGHAIAMEGALKLKEISYLHAEAYPASELKHGPLALVTPQTPTVIVLPRDDLCQERLDHRGGEGARRAGPRHHASGRGACPVRPLVRGAGARARARSPAPVHSAAASRLSCRAAAGMRHRQAAQSREIRHGRVSWLRRSVIRSRGSVVRVAVVENMEKTHLGTLGRALDEAGADIELFGPGRTVPCRRASTTTTA